MSSSHILGEFIGVEFAKNRSKSVKSLKKRQKL